MEENTTTEAADDAQAGDSPQPDSTDSTAAVTDSDSSNDTSEDSADADKAAAPEDDADLKEWASKKNLPLDDPLKVAKMYRELERKLGSEDQKQARTQLTSTVDAASEAVGLDDVQAMKNQIAVMDFYMNNPDARTYDAKMGQILADKPYLASDLDTLYLVAKAKTSDEEVLAARNSGKKEALMAVANAERAGAPKASASTRETPKELTDADVGRMSLAEYKEAKAAGKINF